MAGFIDVRAGAPYPGGALSNFVPYRFWVDAVLCHSMEGFLQGLKFEDPDVQTRVCAMVGMAAKRKGAEVDWRPSQTLWWRGVALPRHSDEYQQVLTRGFDAVGKCPGFQKALIATGSAQLLHTVGGTNRRETILTRKEFSDQLHRLRDGLMLADLFSFD
jgi:hypothetical protein